MQKEALEYVKKYDQCQRFAPNIHQPGGVLNPLFSLWPFTQWGLDIVGPFSKAIGNRRWLIVGTDYFTKWVEATSNKSVTQAMVAQFLKHNIICHYGMPGELITNNGTNLNRKMI